MTRVSAGWGALFFAIGCATAEASREPEPTSLVSAVAALSRGDKGVDEFGGEGAVETSEERRRHVYAASDMQVHGCTIRSTDGGIIGKGCPSGIVVFGPYVSAPADSELRVRFDIQSTSELNLMSDVLSSGTKQFHAALDDQVIRPNQRQTIQYRIHLFDATRALETRVGLRADRPANFEITNFELSIQ